MALIRLATNVQPFQQGRAFGEVGAYEELTGEAEFAVDPHNPLNQVIQDLDIATCDVRGRVHFTADVRILRPVDLSRGNRGLYLDVVNRGASVFMRMLEPGPMGPHTGVTEGFLLRRGFTVVSCGWQHDVPRGNGSFGLSAPRVTSPDCFVTGCGFLALRDVVSHLRDAYGLTFAVALGASQSGRLLRHLVYLGACEDEDEKLILDGVLPVAAGPRMTEANQRFGEPSSNGPKASAFPFTDAEILARGAQRGKAPKLVQINTSSEYWSSSALEHISAAVCHTTPNRRADLLIPDSSRMYLCASTQHAPAPLDDTDDARGVYPPNSVDYKPFVRAAVDNLTAWITPGVPPPASVYPRFSDGTLTEQLDPVTDADGNEVGGLRHPDVAVPLATYTGWNPSIDDAHGFVRALGSTRQFPIDVIGQRYPSREAYLHQVRVSAKALARERYLLDADVEAVVDASAERWNLYLAMLAAPATVG
jgi:hypothetical protein